MGALSRQHVIFALGLQQVVRPVPSCDVVAPSSVNLPQWRQRHRKWKHNKEGMPNPTQNGARDSIQNSTDIPTVQVGSNRQDVPLVGNSRSSRFGEGNGPEELDILRYAGAGSGVGYSGGASHDHVPASHGPDHPSGHGGDSVPQHCRPAHNMRTLQRKCIRISRLDYAACGFWFVSLHWTMGRPSPLPSRTHESKLSASSLL